MELTPIYKRVIGLDVHICSSGLASEGAAK
jgi:hypothetical protein